MLHAVSDHEGVLRESETNIVATEHTDDLAASIKLHEEPLVEVLVSPSSAVVQCGESRETLVPNTGANTHSGTWCYLLALEEEAYLLELWLCGRHLEILEQA